MKIAVCFAILVASSVCTAGSTKSRQKRNLFKSVSIGPGFRSGFRFPFGSGFGLPNPFAAFNHFGGFPFMRPMFPFPTFDFPQFAPWYKGPNVCQSTKNLKEQSPFEDEFGGFNVHSSSESCRGNNEKIMCLRRINTEEGSKLQAITFKCCDGFVRRSDGQPGCEEAEVNTTSIHTDHPISPIPSVEVNQPKEKTSSVEKEKPTDKASSVEKEKPTDKTSSVEKEKPTDKTSSIETEKPIDKTSSVEKEKIPKISSV